VRKFGLWVVAKKLHFIFRSVKEVTVKVLRKEQNIGFELECCGKGKRCGRVPGRGCWG
jgi:hypothetical protein